LPLSNFPLTLKVARLDQTLRLRREIGPLPENGEDLTAQFMMRQHLRLPVDSQLDPELFSRRQRLRITENLFVRDNSQFRGGEDLLIGLAHPEGAKAHGIDAEDAVIVVAGDDSSRSLRAGGEEPAKPAVHGMKVRGHPLDDTEDRREDQLHRFEEGEAVAADQPLQGAIEILRIAAAIREIDTEHPRFFAQTGNGVDLAVVTEQGEGLSAQDGREGVGGVAAVADGDAGQEFAALQLRIVTGQNLRGAVHLVGSDGRREGRDLDGEFLLQRKLQCKEAAGRTLHLRTVQRHLPKERLARPGAGGEDFTAHRRRPLDQHLEAGGTDAGKDAALHLRPGAQILPIEEEMADGKAGIVRQLRPLSGVAEDLLPQNAGDIGE